MRWGHLINWLCGRFCTVFAAGRKIAELPVPVQPVTHTLLGLPLPPQGASLVFVADPGPYRVDPILANGDQRLVSILFLDPALAIRGR